MKPIIAEQGIVSAEQGKTLILSLQSIPAFESIGTGFVPKQAAIMDLLDASLAVEECSAVFLYENEVHAVNVGSGSVYLFRKGELVQKLDPNPLKLKDGYRPYFKERFQKEDMLLICDSEFRGDADAVRIQIELCQSGEPSVWLRRLNTEGRAAAVKTEA